MSQDQNTKKIKYPRVPAGQKILPKFPTLYYNNNKKKKKEKNNIFLFSIPRNRT